jgi:hypothetical protein
MKILILALIALLALNTSLADVTKGGFGAEKEPSPKATEPKSETAPKRTTYPFYGILESVDPKEKTITLRGKKKNRIILCSSESRIFRNGAVASLTDSVPGERVSGSVRKNAEGKEEALTIRFAAKTARK